MRNLKTIAYIFFLTFVSFTVVACSGKQKGIARVSGSIIISDNPGNYFSLTTSGSLINIIFASHVSKSLILKKYNADKPLRKQQPFTESIDIIDTSPEVNPYFGNHSFLTYNKSTNIFYIDQQTEDRLLLKRIYRDSDKKPWIINIINPSGRIVTAIPYTGSDILLIWNRDVLYYGVFSQNKQSIHSTRQKYLLKGDVSSFKTNKLYGFTSYDVLSGKLLLFTFKNNRLKSRVVSDFGYVNYAETDKKGNLKILAYNKQDNFLTFLTGYPPNLKQRKVTPARLTNSVYFFSRDNLNYFIYDEFVPGKNGYPLYRISLLFPFKGLYKRQTIFKSSDTINKFKAVLLNGRLYLLVLQNNLKLIEFQLKSRVDF